MSEQIEGQYETHNPQEDGAGQASGQVAAPTTASILHAALLQRQRLLEAYELQKAEVHKMIAQQKLEAARSILHNGQQLSAAPASPGQTAAPASPAPASVDTNAPPIEIAGRIHGALEILLALRGAGGEAAAGDRRLAVEQLIGAIQMLIAREVARHAPAAGSLVPSQVDIPGNAASEPESTPVPSVQP